MAAGGKGKEEWLMYVKENLEENELEAPETKSSVCIFGIAHPFSRLKAEAYIPQVISIGPYHYRRLEQYEETDGYKLKMARALERKVPGRLKELVEHIQPFDGRIRACYHKHIPFSKEMLSWMLALDAYFVLQFLESIYKPYADSSQNETRPMLLESIRNTPLWYAIRKDILMLENQVPMLLLVEAFDFTKTYRHSEICRGDVRCHQGENLATMLQATCMHFDPFVREEEYRPPALELSSTRHVLDCLYHLVAPSPPYPEPKQDASKSRRKALNIPNPRVFIQKAVIRFIKWMLSATSAGNFPCATVLSDAGIKFAPYHLEVEDRRETRSNRKAYESGDLCKIRFEKTISTFFLPKITINDSTEAVLRNLVAFELNLNTKQKPLTRYTYLMDRLIDTERDVSVLKKRGVIDSHMGSDAEVAHMWNSMSKSTWENTFEPVDRAIEEANKYYRNKWRVMLAQFLKTHCSKPWLVVSLLSAAVLLFFTGLQVLCLFYTCHKQSISK